MKDLLFKSNIRKLFILILILATNLLVSVNAVAESDDKDNQDSLLFLGNQNYPPMVYIENASVKGVAVDVTIALEERMGNTGLLSEINKGLKDIKEDGTYQRIIKKWQSKEVVFFTRDQIRLRQYEVGIGILAFFVIVTSVGAILLLRQLSKSKQLDQELRSQKELLDAVIENIPDPFGIYDKDRNLIKMNAAGRKLYPQQEKIKTVNLAHSSFEYFDLEGNEILPEDLPACRAYRGEFVRNAVIVIKREEKEQITEVNATPIYDKDNNLVSMASYHRDITEMVLNQREIKKHQELQLKIKMEREMVRLDKLSLVGTVAAGIGHEVRNPMTTVRGFLQLLSTKEDCSKYNDYFALMIDELDRANSIITEFLSLAKDRVVEFKVENLKEIVETIFPLIQANGLVSDKYIHLDLEEVPEFPLDKKEINQLILNLVLNGSHAMSPGGDLRIKTFMDKGKIVLSVQDNGGGIAQDVLDKIGTPFFTTKENGTGLGLAVCYSIAARHNAKIDIETGATGTTFFVRFESFNSVEKKLN